jgi:hypothetical protein
MFGNASSHGKNSKTNKMGGNRVNRNRSSDEEYEEEFLVGPGSNLSHMKSRKTKGLNDEEDEHYLLL